MTCNLWPILLSAAYTITATTAILWLVRKQTRNR